MTDITLQRKDVIVRVFVTGATGATGWIGSAVVPELIGAVRGIVRLVRSERAALTAAGAKAHRGPHKALHGRGHHSRRLAAGAIGPKNLEEKGQA